MKTSFILLIFFSLHMWNHVTLQEFWSHVIYQLFRYTCALLMVSVFVNIYLFHQIFVPLDNRFYYMISDNVFSDWLMSLVMVFILVSIELKVINCFIIWHILYVSFTLKISFYHNVFFGLAWWKTSREMNRKVGFPRLWIMYKTGILVVKNLCLWSQYLWTYICSTKYSFLWIIGFSFPCIWIVNVLLQVVSLLNLLHFVLLLCV
jgi:hypothetical protein